MSISLITTNTIASISLSAGVTHYQKLAVNNFQSNATETALQVPYYTAGTFSKFTLRVTVNATTTGAGVVKLRINAADGNQSITIPIGTTGWFTDSSNTDTITSGDLVNYQFTGGVGGSITYTIASVLYDTGAGVCSHVFAGAQQAGLSADSYTYFMSIGGIGLNATEITDTSVQLKAKTNSTLKNISTIVYGNARITDSLIVSRVNGADGNLLITVPALTTGTFADTANTDTIVVDDLINVGVTNDIGGGSLQVRFISIELVTANDKNHYVAANNAITGNTVAASAVSYVGVAGSTGGNTAADTNGTKCNVSFAASNLSSYIYRNDFTTDSNIVVWKNGAAKTNTLTIPAATTGFFEDTTNSDFFAAGDLFSYRITAGSGGTGLLVNNISTLIDYAALPPPSLVDAIFFAGD